MLDYVMYAAISVALIWALAMIISPIVAVLFAAEDDDADDQDDHTNCN